MSEIVVTEIEWNESNYEYVFNSWDGPVGRHIRSRSERLAELARSTAGIRTGRLKAAIGTDYSGELTAKIGVNPHLPDSDRHGYAYYHHEGTLPHLISARRAKALRFLAAGMPIFRYSVHHPGTKPNPYLTMYLREAVN